MRKLLVTFFWSGLSPVAPGTFGSAAASLLLAVVAVLHPSNVFWQSFLVAGLLMASGLMVALGPWAVEYFGRKDPQSVVMDEVAGILLANLLLPATGHPIWTIVMAFAAFRLFDVTKPPPARQLEKLPLGWGILCDDLAAAVYANLLCQLVVRLV